MSADIIQFPGAEPEPPPSGDPLLDAARACMRGLKRRPPPLSASELIALRQMIEQYNDPAGGSYLMKRHMVDYD